jgi:hypothetical protein
MGPGVQSGLCPERQLAMANGGAAPPKSTASRCRYAGHCLAEQYGLYEKIPGNV